MERSHATFHIKRGLRFSHCYFIRAVHSALEKVAFAPVKFSRCFGRCFRPVFRLALCALWFTGFPHCPRYTVFTVPALIVVHAIHVPIPRRLSACTFGVLYPTPVRGMLSAGATTIRKVDTVRTVRASLDAVRRSWGVPPLECLHYSAGVPPCQPLFQKTFPRCFFQR